MNSDDAELKGSPEEHLNLIGYSKWIVNSDDAELKRVQENRDGSRNSLGLGCVFGLVE